MPYLWGSHSPSVPGPAPSSPSFDIAKAVEQLLDTFLAVVYLFPASYIIFCRSLCIFFPGVNREVRANFFRLSGRGKTFKRSVIGWLGCRY